MPKCPICDGAVKPRGENSHYPFCNARCKMIDLGKWMNEEYRVPAAELDEDEDGGGGPSEGGSKTNEDVRH